MMKSWSKVVMFSGTLGLSASCGMFQTKDKGKKFQQNDSALADRWQSECVPASILDQARTKKDYRYGALGDFDRRESFFTDESCNSKAFTYQLLGTFAALGSEDDSDTKQINYTVDKAFITPESEDAAAALTEAKFCDISNWKMSESREVTGEKCLGVKLSKGDVIYDLYQVDNKTLYLGDNSFLGEGLKLTSRPNDVVQDIPLKSSKS